MSEKPVIGIIGPGIMGGAFARHCLSAGFTVIGHDIVDANVTALVEHGGQPAQSACDVAMRSDVIITSLPSIASFHDVMNGNNSICTARKQGLVVIECSTLAIEDKQSAHNALAAVGSTLLDCPISGTGAQAQTRDLSVYVSGDESASKQCQAVFDSIANHTFYVGEFGNGSKMKFVANVLVHIHNLASAEAMVLGIKAGLNPETILNVVKAGAGNSRIFELRAPMMVNDDYTQATMKMDVWQKDIQVISDFAKNLQCPTPLFTAGTEIYQQAMAQGMAKLDTASVCRVLEQMADVQRS